MLILRSERLWTRIDPRHDGEVVDLIDLVSGCQLLGRPLFGSQQPQAGDLEEDVWLNSYRGGGQMLTPSAGNRCEVGRQVHGFHGQAFGLGPGRPVKYRIRATVLREKASMFGPRLVGNRGERLSRMARHG